MEFTQEEAAAMRAEYGKGSTDSQWSLFLNECKAQNLRPGVHLVFQLRNAKEYDPTVGASVFVKKAYWITTIAALRLIAQRTGEYLGQAAEEYIYLDDQGAPTIVSNIPLPDPTDKTVAREPWVVRTKVYRKGFSEPMVGVARFEAYAGTQKSSDGRIRLTDMWLRRGSEQLSKCSEALALRKSFPAEMGNLFISEEIKNEVEEVVAQPAAVLTPAPSAPIVPKVDQTPAEGKEEPRPGEEKPIPTLVELILDKPVAPEPEKKKAGRPKKEVIPDNGQPDQPKKAAHDREDLGITQEDIDNAQLPQSKTTPEEDAALLADSMAFAEDVGSATPTPDLLPTKEQREKFTAHARELIAAGVDNKLLEEYIIGRANKKKSSELTVGEWESAFEILDAAKEAGTLKEVVKPV